MVGFSGLSWKSINDSTITAFEFNYRRTISTWVSDWNSASG